MCEVLPMRVCIVCGKEFDEYSGEDENTCSYECYCEKAKAVALYIRRHRDEIIKKAIEEYKKKYGGEE